MIDAGDAAGPEWRMGAALGWLSLGLAVLLVPLGDRVRARVDVLTHRGRLQGARSHRAARSLLPGTFAGVPAPAAGAVALLLVTLRAGPVLGAAAGLAAATIAQLAISAARARSDRRSRRSLLAAVRTMLAELEAGADPPAALAAAAQADPIRAPALHAAAEAVRSAADPLPDLLVDPGLAPVAHAWRVAVATGAPVSAALGRVANDLGARIDLDHTVAAALAGPRSSAAVLALLPVLGVLLGLSLDADPVGFLTGSTGGQVVCLVGVLLDVAGLAWTRQLAAVAERG